MGLMVEDVLSLVGHLGAAINAEDAEDGEDGEDRSGTKRKADDVEKPQEQVSFSKI